MRLGALPLTGRLDLVVFTVRLDAPAFTMRLDALRAFRGASLRGADLVIFVHLMYYALCYVVRLYNSATLAAPFTTD